MTQKNITHRSDIISRQSNAHGRNALVAIGFLLVVGFVLGLVAMLPKAKSDVSANSVAAVQYSNAMAMQYAQPWLAKPQAEAASIVQFSDSLAMQYAQPWLAKSQTAVASVVPFNDALAMQYAQPWLAKQRVEATLSVPYSNALAMQYAQPWLAKQPVDVPDALYSNALAIFYAQPWLEAQQASNCNGRLDMMYACQNGY